MKPLQPVSVVNSHVWGPQSFCVRCTLGRAYVRRHNVLCGCSRKPGPRWVQPGEVEYASCLPQREPY